jgi:glutamate formiminotransferase/formiminotetrahydrofolate cyclodeaminase
MAEQVEAKLSQTVADYLDALASDAPAPGGGSASALAGALAAALVSMVARFTVGRPKFAAVESEMRSALDEAEALRRRLLALMEDDERAYLTFGAAVKLPRGTDEERRARSRAIQKALLEAAQPPLQMAAACRRILELAGVVGGAGNPNLVSDASVAALLAEAALRASVVNVRVNLAQLRNLDAAGRLEAEVNRLVESTPSLKEEIVAVCGRRMAES